MGARTTGVLLMGLALFMGSMCFDLLKDGPIGMIVGATLIFVTMGLVGLCYLVMGDEV